MTDRTPEKSSWYRISEREHKKTPAVLKPGTSIQFSRSIARAGYWVQPRDLAGVELNKAVLRWLAERTHHLFCDANTALAVGPEPFERVIQTILELLEPEAANMYYLATGNAAWAQKYHIPLRNLYRELRKEWMFHQKQALVADSKKELCYLRTFWYIDHEQKTSTIEEIVTRQIGVYESAGGSPYEHNWCPPYLTVWLYQSVYMTQSGEMVHPLDAQLLIQDEIG